jgi:hypothetical protein
MGFLRNLRTTAEERAREQEERAREQRKRTLETEIADLITHPRDPYLEQAKTLVQRCTQDGFTSADLPLTPYVEWLVAANEADDTGRTRELDAAISIAAAWSESVELPLTVRNVLRALEYRRRELALSERVARGFEPIRKESDGTVVYLDVEAYYGRSEVEGRFVVTDKGVHYVGEVRVEIPWSKITHLHSSGQEFSIQESRRRTPTKFQFALDWNEHFAVLEWCWRRFQTVAHT